MRILVVSHDADFSGAPKVAFDLASEFAHENEVHLLSKKEGPLIGLEKYKPLLANYQVTKTSHAYGLIPFNRRLQHAIGHIKALKPDIVYANSVASSEWAVAARHAGVFSVLHTHEMMSMLRSLSQIDLFKFDLCDYVDLLVSASEEATADMHQIAGKLPLRRHEFGIAIGMDDILARAAASYETPRSVAGSLLSGARPIIGMCGTAQIRKGFDIFCDLALRMPECDFVWIGPLSDEPLVKEYLKKTRSATNLFLTGETANPYPFIKMLDVFFLTSREDPNPLVVAEAITLGRRVVSFFDTGGSWFWTKRFGYCLSGSITIERSISFLKRLTEQAVPPFHLSSTGLQEFKSHADLPQKAHKLMHMLANFVRH